MHKDIVVVVEDRPNKIIEITPTRVGHDVLVFQDDQFLAVAKKINFKESVRATLEGDTIQVVAAVTQNKFDFIVDQAALTNGSFQLPKMPLNPSLVRLIPQGGVEQINGVDFRIEGNSVIFKDLGLDGFIEVGEMLIVIY